MKDKRDLALVEKLRDMEDADFGRFQQASAFFSIIGIIAAAATIVVFFVHLVWFSPSAAKPYFLTFLPLVLAGILYIQSRAAVGIARMRRIIRHLARQAEGTKESA